MRYSIETIETSVTDAIKTTSKKVIQKTVEETGDLLGYKIADKKYRSLKKFTSE